MRRFTILLLTLLLVACDGEPQQPLRIGLNPWPGYEFLYLAEQRQLFREQGADVRVIQFSSLNDARRAFERGQIDGFGGTLVELLMSRQNSPRKAQAVYIPDYSHGGDLLIAGPALTSLSALEGKQVAVEPGTLNTFVLARALEKNGLSIDQVQLVAMPQHDMLAALNHGDVQAVVSYPPFSVAILKQPGMHSLFDTREIPGEVLDMLAVDEAVIKQRPDQVRAMLRAFDAAVEYAHQHPQEAYALMAEREGLKPEEFAATVEEDLKVLRLADQATFFDKGGQLLPALHNTQQVLLRSGDLRAELDLPALISPLILGP